TVCPGDLSNSEPLRIGNHPMDGLPCFLKGMIDEVSIYNRALSAAEVQTAAQRKADKALLSLSPATEAKAARVRAMSRQAGGAMRIEFSGGATTYVVEATTNLKDWEPIGTAVHDADGSFHIEDADAKKFSQRFYRIVPQ
ncbi:MAG TPA: LamG-like jellyroll fold domain-containing protein, partial [Verrucomicrobiae bacterium]